MKVSDYGTIISLVAVNLPLEWTDPAEDTAEQIYLRQAMRALTDALQRRCEHLQTEYHCDR